MRASQEDNHEVSPIGWQTPPAPVPGGYPEGDFEQALRTWSVADEAPGHLDFYVNDSFWRFLHTWGMVRDDTGTALELGSNPYFITYFLAEHTELEVTLANFHTDRGLGEARFSLIPPHSADRMELTYPMYQFNVEEEIFPFDADSFDVVFLCEMLEHLTMDPVRALREIHRVLKPGGALILTTPNVARLDNVLSLVNGVNIYDPYSGFGPYGRHNREYNRHELHLLLEFVGFAVEYSFTADGHAHDFTRWPRLNEIARLVDYRREDLGQYLFVRARATGSPKEGLPSFLYRSWSDGVIVECG
jgi:SAM-dependent methyltransferase